MSTENNQDLTLDKIGHIGIGELCSMGVDFLVPYYQRGYRWRAAQIETLIDDIMAFDPKQHGSFYCLQPMVVRKDNEKWRLIDGQQRLTTIWLILNILKPEQNGRKLYSIFNIDFERENCLPEDFRGEIRPDSSTEENFYLTEACRCIRSKLKSIDIADFQDKLLKKTEVIWYPVEGDIKREYELFINLNSGRISLTDAELVKALLFHDIERGEQAERTLRQISMAQQWDMMEKNLRQPPMWYFIAGRQPLTDNAMDYFLDVYYRAFASSEERLTFDKYEFPAFSWLEKRSGDVWDEISTVYDYLQGWYNDTETYNLVGYSMTACTDATQRKEHLARLIRWIRKPEMTRKKFLAKLWVDATPDDLISEQDKKLLKNEKYSELSIFKFHYKKDYARIFRLLALINIALCTVGGFKRRFEFERFNDPEHPWNVEHISPNNPKDNKELYERLKDTRVELPEDVRKLFGYLEKVDDSVEKDFNLLGILTPVEREEFQSIKARILPFEDEKDIMTLRNLTLLTEHENKSIGNNFFFDKRLILRRKQEEGHYIPPASWNVFTKWYSNEAKSPMFWEDADRKAYGKGMALILKRVIDYVTKNYSNELPATVL